VTAISDDMVRRLPGSDNCARAWRSTRVVPAMPGSSV